MDDEITNERLFLEVRKNHRRMLGLSGMITLEVVLLIGVVSGGIPAIAAVAVLSLVMLLVLISAEGLQSGGRWASIANRLPFPLPESEPELEQRFGEGE